MPPCGEKLRDNIEMASNGHGPTVEMLMDDTRAQRAMRAAAAATFREHKLLGLPIAIWKDGKAVWLQPEDISPEDMGQVPATESH